MRGDLVIGRETEHLAIVKSAHYPPTKASIFMSQDTTPKRNLTPRVPGEPIPAAQMPPQEPEPKAHEPEASAEISEDTQVMIEAEVARRVKEELQKRKAAAVPQSALPRQDQVDANTISRAVLTQDGYVVPIGKSPKGLI